MKNALPPYIAAKVKDLAKTNDYDEELEKEVAAKLASACHGNYLWVDIVCASLRNEETWYAIEHLDDVSRTNVLDDSLYNYYMLSTFERHPRRDREFCRTLLSTMALMNDALPMDELDALVYLDKRVNLMSIIKKCSAFLIMDNRRVSFVHRSAKAYIRERVLDNAQVSGIHSELAQKCMDYVWQTLKTKRAVRPGLANKECLP
ncbi:hypothetical protein F5B19DRAFT_491985 [Rostrohypoxylon terebratum]|nr:hypothetical protein F5B19DRAFT_491985 [Rostrohypoxylon terebratum]